MLDIKTIKFKNYKSFTDEFNSIENLKDINVFIGRNNSGKSSCIDIIQFLIEGYGSDFLNIPEIKIEKILCREDCKNSFNTNTEALDNLMRLYMNKIIEFRVSLTAKHSEFDYIRNQEHLANIDSHTIENNLNIKLRRLNFIRLNAERNIEPEHEEKNVVLSENGRGAINVIHHILNFEKYNEKLINEKLLKSLNEIIFPDSKYDGITVQRISSEKWEVYLYENDNRFGLSQMGSGLKTIILVLLKLLVIPYVTMIGTKEEADYSEYIFAFEELENNLHPALQRRLFEFLNRFSIENNTTILLTTHSHVAINMFADKENAQLYHVKKENGKSSVNIVEDYITKYEILNDLDVRASDLLQSNGIIWVEGPSDRIYIKHWLEMWGNNDIVEGVDYQFLYYGGRILSHFTADYDSEDEKLIKILTTNRNSAIVIDSDIHGNKNEINSTKKRIKSEYEKSKMFCWITEGKEMENYIPYSAINSAYNTELKNQCGKSELFPNYINSVIKSIKFDKVGFAHKVVEYIDDNNSKCILDLKERILELIETIRRWNAKM